MWRSSSEADKAATSLKVTAQDLAKLGVIDRILNEPLGGAHRDRERMIQDVGMVVAEELARMSVKSPGELINERRQKFLDMGRIGIT